MNDHSVLHPRILESLGFQHFEPVFAPYAAQGLVPARVAAEHRAGYALLTEHGEIFAELAGRFRHEAASRLDLPAVGDWVAFRGISGFSGAADQNGMNIHSAGERAVVHAVLPRRTAFVRGVAGGASEPQIVAANVDVVLVVCAVGQDLNPRRLERYLTAVRSSGAEVAIALTKTDLAGSTDRSMAEVSALAGGAPIVAVSNVTGEGIDDVAALVAGHRTMALVGSSGVGKSTLLNRLRRAAVEATPQTTGPLGADGRGRHTTTHRELFVLPQGGLVLDTPGMRELRLWDAARTGEGLDETFADVAAFAARCRFGDCAHDAEPGCAVRAALEEGTLPAARWASWDKLQRELHALARRSDARLASEDKRRIKVFSRAARVRDRHRR